MEKGNVGLELWGKNILNTSYNAFYFEPKDISGPIGPYAQHGNPVRIGATLKYTIAY
jgi:hypothetical protein